MSMNTPLGLNPEVFYHFDISNPWLKYMESAEYAA